MLLVVLSLAGISPALEGQQPPPAAVAPGAQTAELLAPAALADLLGPIALYPDALIALILPASTMPRDISLAARYLAGGGDGNQVASQPWDDSVKSLARYPEVVKWLDDNLEWTSSVGDAFVAQPADVMNAVQALREQARAAGNLVDTPQQRVVQEVVREKTYIRIVPSEPEVIYVPQYDPQVVYVERQPDFIGPIIGFGVGFAVGSWLNYDCDWGRNGVYYGDYRPGWNNWNNWNGGNGWNGGGGTIVNNNSNVVNVTNITNTSAQAWQPNANTQQQFARRQAAYDRRVREANAEAHAQAGRPAKVNGRPVAPPRLKSLPQPGRINVANNPRNPANKRPDAPAARPPGTKRPAPAPDVPGQLGKPGQVKPARPPGERPTTAKPLPAKPSADRPSQAKPQRPRPPQDRPEAVKPRPQQAKPKVEKPRPQPAKPQAEKPRPRPQQAKPQPARPQQQAKPERPKPQQARPQKPQAKPERPRPQQARPQQAKPQQAKPQQAKPTPAKGKKKSDQKDG